MKFTAECDKFQTALSFVQRGIATRTTQPILSNVLVTAEDKVTLRATNLVVDLQTSFPAEIEKGGDIVVAPSQLIGFLVANSGEIKVFVDKMMSVSAGKSKIKLSTISAVDFPEWKSFESITSFTIERNELKNMLDSVGFAVAKDARRPILTGTYFNASHKLIVGADGIRMAMVNFDKMIGDLAVVISQQGIEEVKRLALLSDQDIEVKISQGYTEFNSGDYRILVNHLAGEYPANAIGIAEKVKEREHEVEVRMKKASLLKVCGVANLFQTGLISIPLRLTCSGKIEVEIESDAGSYKDNVEGEVVRGDISILVSPSHIIDVINQVKGDEVIFLMSNPHQPIVILDPSNENWSVVQVPIADKAGVEAWEAEKRQERKVDF